MTCPRPWGGPSARSVACSHSCREKKKQTLHTGSASVTYSSRARLHACKLTIRLQFVCWAGKGGQELRAQRVPYLMHCASEAICGCPCSRGTVDVQWTSSGRYSGRPKTGLFLHWTSTQIEECLTLPFPKFLTSTVRKRHFLDVHCNVQCTSTGRPLCIHSTPHTRPDRPVFFFWLAHAPLGGHTHGSLRGAQATPPAGGANRATRPGPSMSPPTAGHLLVVVGVSTLLRKRNQEPATCPR